MNITPSRRDFLYGLGATLGTSAFNAMLQAEDQPAGPLAPKPPHHPAKAKACIMLYMAGGPSHIDLFDPEPKLEQLHMQEFTRKDKFASAMASGKRYFIKSPFKFTQAGESGLWMCDKWKQLAGVADELCVYHGCQATSINHPTANYHMNTGNRFGGDPAIGAWAGYGLGSENQDLPCFVVLPEVNFPQGGSANWSNGFLPAYFQGTPLRAEGSPILDLQPPPGVTKTVQRKNLDLLAQLNAEHRARHPQHDALAARMESYEVLSETRPDIVAVAGWSFPESVSAIAWARDVGARVVMMSESQAHDAQRQFLGEAIKRRVVEACDAALVGAEPHRQYIAKLGIPKDRVFFGYNAVDNDYFEIGSDAARKNRDKLRRKLDLPQRYVLASGRMIKKKGFPQLVGAFSLALRRKDVGHALMILGDGPERPTIETVVADANLRGRVLLPGFKSYDLLPAYYALADGFVHVAFSEQWGLVVNEAAAAGLPLIVSEHCGVGAALVESGRNGRLINPNDISEIADALVELFSKKSEELSRIGVESRQIASAWGPARFANGLYRACIAALTQPTRRIAPWDRALLRFLASRSIDRVS